ncbi:MAG: carbamoyltransferase family protein, partial [Chitinophagaceae bacterium]
AIKYCLEYSHISISDISAIAFYDKPFLKFERLIETYVNNVPKGLGSFLKAVPVWTKEKLFLKKIIRDELKKMGNLKKIDAPILFPEHHLSHAASAFFASPFRTSAILVADGVGEWATTTIAFGENNKITILKELHFPHSVGLLYSSVTYYCGFKVNSGEYKLMGLSPYATDEEEVNRLEKIINSVFCTVYPDGSIELNQEYFTYASGLRMVNDKKWTSYLGFPRRKPESEIDPCYCNLAMAVQRFINQVMLSLATEAKKLTGDNHFCLAGGVALNCVANSVILESNLFEKIFVQPAAGDAGGSLGAALATYYIYFGNQRAVQENNIMQGCLLGPAIPDFAIERFAEKHKAPYNKFDTVEQMTYGVAGLLSEGKVVGWFQGRMEFGPRALGARSILADARIPDMQKKLNLKIKARESFRPFAPAVLEENAADYFEMNNPSPFMLFTYPIRQNLKKPVADPGKGSLQDRVNSLRSSLPAITHIDYSARVQTVNKADNELFWNLLQAFNNITGVPVLINTSFNRRGEPIVCSLKDAYFCFMESEMDFLVAGNYLFDKKAQPVASLKDYKKSESFIPD